MLTSASRGIAWWQALELRSNITRALLRRAEAHLLLGDLERAQIDVNRGLEVEPHNPLLGQLQLRLRRQQRAADAHDKTIFQTMLRKRASQMEHQPHAAATTTTSSSVSTTPAGSSKVVFAGVRDDDKAAVGAASESCGAGVAGDSASALSSSAASLVAAAATAAGKSRVLEATGASRALRELGARGIGVRGGGAGSEDDEEKVTSSTQSDQERDGDLEGEELDQHETKRGKGASVLPAAKKKDEQEEQEEKKDKEEEEKQEDEEQERTEGEEAGEKEEEEVEQNAEVAGEKEEEEEAGEKGEKAEEEEEEEEQEETEEDEDEEAAAAAKEEKELLKAVLGVEMGARAATVDEDSSDTTRTPLEPFRRPTPSFTPPSELFETGAGQEDVKNSSQLMREDAFRWTEAEAAAGSGGVRQESEHGQQLSESSESLAGWPRMVSVVRSWSSVLSKEAGSLQLGESFKEVSARWRQQCVDCLGTGRQHAAVWRKKVEGMVGVRREVVSAVAASGAVGLVG